MGIDYIKNERRDFSNEQLLENNTPNTPFLIFKTWFEEAISNNILDANAMVLSTINEQQKPTSRVVLMRDFSELGISFYTNYNSEKAKNISLNPNIALNFFWPIINKQIRIEGKAEKLDIKTSEEYFKSRPTSSKLGAWSSPQSNLIENREVLEKNFKKYQTIFLNQEISKPDFWGGFLIRPIYFEFWLGRDNRLHDRLIYKLENQNSWIKLRLAP